MSRRATDAESMQFELADDLRVLRDEIEAMRPLVSQMTRIGNSPQVSSGTSNVNITAGHWINMLAVAAMGAIALTQFFLYVADRDAAARERADAKAQTRVDVQRVEGDIKEIRGKLETHDAYINEIYRSLNKK